MKKWLFVAVFLVALGSVFGFVYAEKTAGSFHIKLSDHTVNPSQIQASTGRELHITVENTGHNEHNFVIPDFYIFTPNLRSGESTSVGFTPDKKGTFPFYSDTGGSPEPGIQGTIIVK